MTSPGQGCLPKTRPSPVWEGLFFSPVQRDQTTSGPRWARLFITKAEGPKRRSCLKYTEPSLLLSQPIPGICLSHQGALYDGRWS